MYQQMTSPSKCKALQLYGRLTHFKEKKLTYFYLYHVTLRHSSVTMIKTSPLFKLIFYAAVFRYNELFYNTHSSIELNLFYIILM